MLQWISRLLRRRPGKVAPDDDVGRWGEREAEACLLRAGYRVLGRRVRPNRRDELDLVVRRGDDLVFVEVKTRKNEDFGRPVSAVGREKRKILCRAAASYLRRLGYPRLHYRFDVVEVVGQPGATPQVRHIEDAFRFEARYRFPV